MCIYAWSIVCQFYFMMKAAQRFHRKNICFWSFSRSYSSKVLRYFKSFFTFWQSWSSITTWNDLFSFHSIAFVIGTINTVPSLSLVSGTTCWVVSDCLTDSLVNPLSQLYFFHTTWKFCAGFDTRNCSNCVCCSTSIISSVNTSSYLFLISRTTC